MTKADNSLFMTYKYHSIFIVTLIVTLKVTRNVTLIAF
jgi:hypothetical protein